ncbi:hypothetical protein [Amycolatopsis sp.]|uniref:hypothetical protein n=1 Tax=Amycolatopsis sp. TaxID=37632 RepID=UPI002CDC683F|nr:hypothetical protein [Amycolatopsis sp.]HVV11328.1 hypothetical protein [Amycolatopsis sp.]
MATEESEKDDWLADQAKEALAAIAALHEEGMSKISVSPQDKKDAGWFETAGKPET